MHDLRRRAQSAVKRAGGCPPHPTPIDNEGRGPCVQRMLRNLTLTKYHPPVLTATTLDARDRSMGYSGQGVAALLT
jgi:hypothetical protein